MEHALSLPSRGVADDHRGASMKPLSWIWQRIRCLRGRHRFEIMPPALIPSEEDLWETLFTGAFPIYEKCAACGDARRRTRNQSP